MQAEKIPKNAATDVINESKRSGIKWVRLDFYDSFGFLHQISVNSTFFSEQDTRIKIGSNVNINKSESDRDFEKYEMLKDNFDWFHSNYEELKRDFSDQYVAVTNKRRIDNDYNFELLIKRLNLSNCDESIVIEYVC
jgi:hypothetical protein